MKPTRLLLLILASATALSGDTLVMNNGKVLQGTFLGGNARQIDFLQTSGNQISVPLENIASMKFSTAHAKSAVLIPAGTAFRVRTIDFIDVDSTQAGRKFNASLDDPIILGGNVVVPRGAPVVLVASKVEQGGRMKGSDLIQLKVNNIVVGGRSYPVVTTLSETKSAGEGKKTTKKVLGGTGLGAIIGGIAGGGKGAAIGALAGGATGTVVAASGQPHLKIPSETQLDFQLMSDWKLQ